MQDKKHSSLWLIDKAVVVAVYNLLAFWMSFTISNTSGISPAWVPLPSLQQCTDTYQVQCLFPAEGTATRTGLLDQKIHTHTWFKALKLSSLAVMLQSWLQAHSPRAKGMTGSLNQKQNSPVQFPSAKPAHACGCFCSVHRNVLDTQQRKELA